MISVLIPAYNEEEKISQTIVGVQKALSGEEFEILVIDDGSMDQTGTKARASGARVLTMPINQGKGQAVNKGLELATGEVILFIDADLQDSAAQIDQLIVPILLGDADLAIGIFSTDQMQGGWGLVRGLAHHGLYLCTGNRYQAPISGQRALKRRVLDTIGQLAPGWGMEVAMTIDAVRHGFQIVEVPLELAHRQTGHNLTGYLHRTRQFKEIFTVLWGRYWRDHSGKGGGY